MSLAEACLRYYIYLGRFEAADAVLRAHPDLIHVFKELSTCA